MNIFFLKNDLKCGMFFFFFRYNRFSLVGKFDLKLGFFLKLIVLLFVEV